MEGAATMSEDRQHTFLRGGRVLVAALTLCLLASCASVSPSHTGVASTATATPASGLPSRTASGGAPTLVGPAAPDTRLALSLVLRGRAPDALAALLRALSDPRSPQYHHYLTPEQLAAQFGADPAAVARVSSALAAAGLTVGDLAPDRVRLAAHGTVAQIEALFAVRIDAYRNAHGGLSFAAEATPRLPATFGGAVSGVLGLDTRAALHPGALLAPARPTLPNGPAISGVSGLAPADLEKAYNLGPLRSAGLDGTNTTIALAEIDAFHQSDVQSYDQTFGIAAPPLSVITVDGGASSTSPEPVLDIEVAHAVAPKARVLVYESPKDLGSVADMLGRIVADHRAQVLSVSLGTCERGLAPSSANALVSTLTDTFSRAAAEGVSVLVASGDNGAYDCQDADLSVGVLAANPYVTSVGGTALFLSGAGGYGREDGWEGPLEGAGSGGGVSILYAQPSWQTGPGVSNQFSDGMRQVPDVSADADPLTGYSIYYSGGWHVVGGTSAASPLWAAIILLADQRAAMSGKGPLGLLDPALYRLGATGTGYHDVTLGGNLYYNATPGWDYSTGWGSPDGAALVLALVG
jgi:subtilase family serine protease